MKIIYATDIHGDFERVKSLLSETVAQLYIIAGDLIDIPFYNMEASIRYHELQTFFHGLRRRMNAQEQVLEDFVDELLKAPQLSEELRSKATRYQHYTIRARRVMQQKYKVLKNIISAKHKSRVLCLPGNYDMNLKFTSLHDNDLHLHVFSIDDLRVSGYGGADVWTSGIPQRYIVKYQAGIGVHETENEMYRYFEEAKPDIIVTHQPAYGIHDRLAAHGPFGSLALRRYCDTHPVVMCLTGHVHDSWGVTIRENTLYLNPSNFGEVTNPTGDVSEGGFFHQIELKQHQVTSVILKKLSGDRIYDVADYYPQGGGWQEKIVDNERYQSRKNRDNYDLKIAKYSHIPEIQLFNEIKKFYRMFQTPETEERLGKLEEVAHILEEQLKGDIAMDVVGSVNIGLSLPGSDIDFILYLRCDAECNAGFGACELFKNAQAMIKGILGNSYDTQIMDCVNLNKVNASILEKNYECETLQRFVAYRSLGRPINYRVIAPIDDLLNQDMIFRKEVEGSIQTYFQIFSNTSQHIRSLKKYESRLNAIGIKLPEYIRRKIKQYLTSA